MQAHSQMVLLPLKDPEGRPTRIIGALQAKGTIGRGPRRFNITDQKINAILSDRPEYTDFSHHETQTPKHTPAQTPAPAAGFAERRDGFAGKPAGKPTVPGLHLRLVHDADSNKG